MPSLPTARSASRSVTIPSPPSAPATIVELIPRSIISASASRNGRSPSSMATGADMRSATRWRYV